MGFGIEDIRALLAMWHDRGRSSADVKALALARAAELKQKARQIEAMRRSLEQLAAECHGDQRPDCPILQDLETGRELTSNALGIGTSALAVAVNAATGLASHARAGTVKWRCALTFAAAGIAGAFAGSSLGKAFDGQRLLFLFALVMIAVGVLMLRRSARAGDPGVRLGRDNALRLLTLGAGAGAFSGFFGIGGGFLIVPGLVAATGMPMINAIGSSLVGVAAFGMTTAANYALSGLVDWLLAAAFIGGGLVGGLAGARLARRLSESHAMLTRIFAALIFAVAAYMLWMSGRSLA